MALMLSFAACGDDEQSSDGNDNNTVLTATQVVGTWESKLITVNDEEMDIEMRITMNADGTGYLDDPNDVFHYTISGMNIIVTPPNGGSHTFTVESITETEMMMTGTVIPGTGQQASFKGWFAKVNGDNPGGGDDPDPTGATWVDLGLPSGLLWASCNVGATAPEEFGYLFAWGETVVKDTLYWGSYEHGYGYHELTKYCSDTSYGLNGYSDNLTTLQPYDDAATVHLGNGARTPSNEDWEEMVANTTHQWTTLNNVNGYLFTAPNGNSIFLPAAGIIASGGYQPYDAGYYWSSSLYTPEPDYAYNLSFGATWFGTEVGYLLTHTYRCIGLSVRAVRVAQK